MQSNLAVPLIIGLLSACSCASTLLWVSVQDRRVELVKTQSASSSRKVAEVAQRAPFDPRVAGLEGQLDDLATRLNALEGRDPAAAGEAGAPRVAPPSEGEVAARLDARLERGGADPTWTASAESELRSWGEALPAGQLGDVRCGASLCRFQLGFDDVGARASVMNALPNQVPWDGEGFAVPVDDEGLVYEIYLAREGASLDGA